AGVEPAAVLVAALEVELDRNAEVRPFPRLAHRGPGRSGIEPDVEDVGLLLELRPAALLAVRARGQQLADGPLEPGVGAFLLEDGGDELHRLRIDERLAVRGAVGDRDGNAPAP